MKNSKRIKDNAIFFLLSVLSILFLVPIIIVFINSFKSRIYISSEPLKLPTSETFVGLENYPIPVQWLIYPKKKPCF